MTFYRFLTLFWQFEKNDIFRVPFWQRVKCQLDTVPAEGKIFEKSVARGGDGIKLTFYSLPKRNTENVILFKLPKQS